MLDSVDSSFPTDWAECAHKSIMILNNFAGFNNQFNQLMVRDQTFFQPDKWHVSSRIDLKDWKDLGLLLEDVEIEISWINLHYEVKQICNPSNKRRHASGCIGAIHCIEGIWPKVLEAINWACSEDIKLAQEKVQTFTGWTILSDDNTILAQVSCQFVYNSPV